MRKVILFIPLFLGLIWLLESQVNPPKPRARWTMINVGSGNLQADAHLLRFPNGPTFLIDAGDYDGTLLRYLQKEKITWIDRILVSHPHKDHYSGIPSLLSSGIKVRTVHVTLPPKKDCDAEKPWGCDYTNLLGLMKSLKNYRVKVENLRSGEVLFQDNLGTLRSIFHAGSPLEATNFSSHDINDMSQILLLTYGKTRVLFTGDTNKKLGKFLVDKFPDIQADLLKVPHHGTESTAENSFFERVGPRVAFVPSPKELWLSERSQRVREFLVKSGSQVYVSGIHGHVTTWLGETGFEVQTEFRGERTWKLTWMREPVLSEK